MSVSGAPEPRPVGSRRESGSVGAAAGIKERALVQTRGWRRSARGTSATEEEAALLGGSSKLAGGFKPPPRTLFACAHTHGHTDTPAGTHLCTSLHPHPPCTLTAHLHPHMLPSTPQQAAARASQPPQPCVLQHGHMDTWTSFRGAMEPPLSLSARPRPRPGGDGACPAELCC